MTGPARILVSGALGMLLVSAVLGSSPGAGAAAGSEAALRAHIHTGSLGWITLAVLAVAVRMVAAGGRPAGPPWLATGLSWLAVVTIAAFVVADAAGSPGGQAWTGTAALAAIVAILAWLTAAGRRARAAWTVPRLAMVAALAVLVAGSIIGAVSAGAAARGDAITAASLASSHSAILGVPFVILAATSVLEWSALPSAGSSRPTTAGLVQVGTLALAAAAVTAGVVTHDLPLVEANIPLEFVGIAIFLARVGPVLLTAGWATSGRIWLVTGTVSLAVDVGLFAHVVFEIGRRRYVSLNTVPQWLLFTVDHVTFVAVGTSALFGAIAAMTGTLDKVSVTERVAYPIPAAGALVGSAQLPFSSEKLALAVAIKGTCFIPQPSGSYVFRGSLSCATSTLTLGTTSYNVSSLLTSVNGSFTPPNPASGADGTGSLTAAFSNPGYTFPVATLGSGGGTTLTIGSNGASVATPSVTFTGSTAAGG